MTARRRDLYSLQLRNLYRFFDKARVLVIRPRDLLQRHDAVLRRVFAFLAVSQDARIAPEMIYPDPPVKDGRGGRAHRTVSWLLSLSYLAEFVRLRALVRHAHSEVPSTDPAGKLHGVTQKPVTHPVEPGTGSEKVRHSRESGDPETLLIEMDSRFRGNDELKPRE